MALNIAALMRYVNGTIPNHTAANDKAADFPEYRDNLDLAFKYYSLGLASGAATPLGTSDEADIRLLEIFPHPTGSGRIRCALHHYCFLVPARRISYIALSYVWGTQEEDRLIVIDGKGFLVTENLQTILWHLRQSNRSVYVWIDAICIYQRMKAEKEMQVSMMNDIFGTADEVVVYLGEEADNSDLVVDFAEVVLKKLLALQDSQPDVTIREEDLGKFGLPPVTDPGWVALHDVFKRPWFERKWIVQEYALAKLITCILGSSRFNFELLILTHKLCLQHKLDRIYLGWRSRLTIPREHPLTILATIRDLIRHNYDEDATAEVKTLPWLLAATSYAKVSRYPHDHIYALLGLHQVSGSFLGLPYPVVNYERSVEDVFIDYACIDDWTKADAEVSLLELASQSKNLNLPSWVPDWTCTTSLEYILHPGPSAAFGASVGKDRSEFIFDRTGKKLSVRAAMFDHITEMIPDVLSEDLPEAWAKEYGSMGRMGFGYLTELSKQRRCTTSKGYRVLVHESCQVGDLVIIILGERVPFVVRHARFWWRLVGCAYFSSIMQGEGLDSNSPYYVGSTTRSLTLV